ncbi:hypothetical protein SAY86_003085 [Trapa natans]|uniref:Uncharacterized protein n=1 Tax=Trapa natans TaxID=22666 RepID=A0AAN7LV99_TRANT|nr:hypothetical protein SAY86_003085 [Trapa natans]
MEHLGLFIRDQARPDDGSKDEGDNSEKPAKSDRGCSPATIAKGSSTARRLLVGTRMPISERGRSPSEGRVSNNLKYISGGSLKRWFPGTQRLSMSQRSIGAIPKWSSPPLGEPGTDVGFSWNGNTDSHTMRRDNELQKLDLSLKL